MRFIKSFSLVSAVLLLLAACESAPKEGGAASGTGTTTKSAATTTAQATPGPRPGSQEELVRDHGDRVFFDFDKSDLTPEAKKTIEGWAGWLKKYPQVTATLEGHCDERGTREYNLALGERRSASVKNLLLANGINAARLKTISYGKERPAVLGSTEAAWAQNRRSVILVD